jgi:hypothetical protein
METAGEALRNSTEQMTRPTLTNQIQAQSAVCAHLGTDLTMARVQGLNIRWRGMESGDHVITVNNKTVYRVDLVVNSVSLRVGTIPSCCAGLI